MCVPVEAAYQSQSNCAEVSGIRHHSAVQRIISQIHWTGERLGYVYTHGGKNLFK